METSTHPISQEELMAYLDGELAADRASVAAGHLEHCRECQAVAADFQSVSRRLLEWQVDEPSSRLNEQLRTALDSRQTTDQKRRLSRLFFARSSWVWAAAGAVVILAIALVISTRQPQRASFATDGQSLADKQQRRVTLGSQSMSAPEASAGLVAGVVGGSGQAIAPPPPPLPNAGKAKPTTGPLIIRNAELSLTTRQFESTRGTLDRVLASYQGYIASLSVSSPPDQGRTLTATLKVPAAQLNSVLFALKKLGRLDAESQTGQEVTQQVVDLEARLSNARNSEQRLTEILRDRTGKLSDVLAVEEQIDNVRGQIEQMKAEQENLSHQIAFASIDLKIAEEYNQPLAVDHSSTWTRLRNAAVDGYRSVIDGATDVVVFLLAYGPGLLIVAAILFFPARALWRKRNRATA